MLGWLLVLRGGFRGLSGLNKGGSGRRDGFVGKSLLADMEIESLESNTTLCPLWSTGEGADKPLESGMLMVEKLAELYLDHTLILISSR